MTPEHPAPADGEGAPERGGPGPGGQSQAVWSLLRAAIGLGIVLGAVELVRPAPAVDSGVTWNWFAIAALTGLLLLVLGPRPRLATRWAWFWLWVTVPPVVLVFVVLEPVPLWRPAAARAVPRPLTGGWALLLGAFTAGLLTTLVPGYAELFPG